ELVPVAMRTQHLFHDGKNELVHEEHMRGARLQQDRPQARGVPPIEITLAVGSRDDPGLELAAHVVDRLRIDEVLEDHVALRPQNIHGGRTSLRKNTILWQCIHAGRSVPNSRTEASTRPCKSSLTSRYLTSSPNQWRLAALTMNTIGRDPRPVKLS